MKTEKILDLCKTEPEVLLFIQYISRRAKGYNGFRMPGFINTLRRNYIRINTRRVLSLLKSTGWFNDYNESIDFQRRAISFGRNEICQARDVLQIIDNQNKLNESKNENVDAVVALIREFSLQCQLEICKIILSEIYV